MHYQENYNDTYIKYIQKLEDDLAQERACKTPEQLEAEDQQLLSNFKDFQIKANLTRPKNEYREDLHKEFQTLAEYSKRVALSMHLNISIDENDLCGRIRLTSDQFIITPYLQGADRVILAKLILSSDNYFCGVENDKVYMDFIKNFWSDSAEKEKHA